MSYSVIVEVYCDHQNADGVSDCENGVRVTRHNQGGLNKTFAGAIAALQNSWYVRGHGGNRDPKVAYCPQHIPEGLTGGDR